MKLFIECVILSLTCISLGVSGCGVNPYGPASAYGELLDSVNGWVTTRTSANTMEGRKAEYRNTVTARREHIFYHEMSMLAYEDVQIQEDVIEWAVNNSLTKGPGDFCICNMVRLLYMTDQYDHLILDRIREIPFWLTRGEDQYNYWSENHMMLWMSSAYLMRQRYGWEMDPTLNQRIHHWLELKSIYGFYEFFSTTYFSHSLGPMLNLYDFADDPEIRRKSAVAIDRMVRELLLVVNDVGAFYPATGRGKTHKYTSFMPKSLFWILTGNGPMPSYTDYEGPFITTTSYDFGPAASSYSSYVDTALVQGHRQKDRKQIHAGFSREDRTIFQWSSGAYFHPQTASDTKHTVEFYDLTGQSEFSQLARVAMLPDAWMNDVSKVAAVYTRGSDLAEARIDIFKNQNVVLTSLFDFYPGYRGYQQWPWAATVHDIAVFTQSGNVPHGWPRDGGVSANTHLPKVQQTDNVALITYNPATEIQNDNSDKGVNLYWPVDRFDEDGVVFSHDSATWLVARREQSYIAVRRPGVNNRDDGHPRHIGDKGRQLWAVVVGNEDMHGDFRTFKQVIMQARVEKRYEYRVLKGRHVYFTGVEVDGVSISNSW